MSYAQINTAINAIATVSEEAVTNPDARIPVYGSEFIQLLDGIRAFRNYFYAKQGEYGFPFDKLLSLDLYIAQFPSPKFQDPFKAKDQNNMVECLKIIADLLPYLEIDYYIAGYYMSPTLASRYVTYFNGHLPNYDAGPPDLSDEGGAIQFQSRGGGYTVMGAAEYWFRVDRHWDTAKVRIKSYTYNGIAGQPFISVCFLTSGEPFSYRRTLCVLDRGDVNIVAKVDQNYDIWTRAYDQQYTCFPFADIKYVVMVIYDESTLGDVWTLPKRLAISA